jgi:hypothetical protein
VVLKALDLGISGWMAQLGHLLVAFDEALEEMEGGEEEGYVGEEEGEAEGEEAAEGREEYS